MISYLKGKTILSHQNFVIVEVLGVGYRVYVNDKCVFKAGDTVELFIYNQVREDCNDLYGFQSFDDLALFEKLITVNGVGPKAALSIMSISSADRIVSAIIEENLTFFQAVPGIGKKVAAKIILELKSKLSGIAAGSLSSKMADSNDLIDALVSLGYKSNEINQIVAKIPGEITDLESRIRWCLKNANK